MNGKVRKPSQRDLEEIVGHFLYYLSNEPDSGGISPRTRLYGTHPIQARMLFPDVSDETILNAVKIIMDEKRQQKDILLSSGASWRTC